MDVEETEDQVCYAANVDIQPNFDVIEAIGIELILPVLHVLFNNMRGYVVARAVYGPKHNYYTGVRPGAPHHRFQTLPCV